MAIIITEARRVFNRYNIVNEADLEGGTNQIADDLRAANGEVFEIGGAIIDTKSFGST